MNKEQNLKPIDNQQLNKIDVKTQSLPINFGTMDRDCEHDIEKLYNKIGDYKADYCKKCGGVY